ncbi:putative portal protein, partial [Dissostichus eleginoides]
GTILSGPDSLSKTGDLRKIRENYVNDTAPAESSETLDPNRGRLGVGKRKRGEKEHILGNFSRKSLWQIARPIKEKTIWLGPNEATTCCSETSPLPPPWDPTSEGSGVTALVVSSATERGGKHRDCRQTGQIAPTLTERLLPRGHRGYVLLTY